MAAFNLLTAFIAASVVGVFEETIDKVVALAVLLPVLAGQLGNTGCQALAVTIRGITLGELTSAGARTLVAKEAWLGFLNGIGTGVSAGIGMLVFADSKGDPNAPLLALIVLLAMVGACVMSGIFGALVPLILRRLGADPATASSIFLTTATDVASMGLFPGSRRCFYSERWRPRFSDTARDNSAGSGPPSGRDSGRGSQSRTGRRRSDR
ncbi:MAG: magnesium transporter [Candidatus Binatia bacterium]